MLALGLSACGSQSESEPTPTENTAESGPAAATPIPATPAPEPEAYEIVTLLPQDAIPAIDNPIFLSIPYADQQYEPDELVLGVEFNGEARAYSIPHLSNHEIVNDTVGGVKIAVTW